MVAAHLRNPAVTLVAVSILTLAAGCSREPEQPESTEQIETITREGVDVEFTVRPTRDGTGVPVAGDWADVTFKVTDANTGDPIKGRYPAAWMDLGAAWPWASAR
jgi:hypothetical protein